MYSMFSYLTSFMSSHEDKAEEAETDKGTANSGTKDVQPQDKVDSEDTKEPQQTTCTDAAEPTEDEEEEKKPLPGADLKPLTASDSAVPLVCGDEEEDEDPMVVSVSEDPHPRTSSPSANWNVIRETSSPSPEAGAYWEGNRSITISSEFNPSHAQAKETALSESDRRTAEQQEEIIQLKEECNILYDGIFRLQKLIQDGEPVDADTIERVFAQRCIRCAESYLFNFDSCCRYHPGEYVALTWHDQPEQLCNAYTVPNRADVSPSRHWKWSCCNAAGQSSPGCMFGRHLSSVEIEEEEEPLDDMITSVRYDMTSSGNFSRKVVPSTTVPFSTSVKEQITKRVPMTTSA